MSRLLVSGEGFAPRVIEAEKGANLLEVLRRGGLSLAADCGGRGTCGKCRVTVDGEQKLACLVAVAGDMMVELPRTAAMEVLMHDGDAVVEEGQSGIGVACDIGTTTLAVYAYDLQTGKLLGRAGVPNPQRPFGADVISRIDACVQQADAGPQMREVLWQALANAVRGFGIEPGRVARLHLTGNTIMLHIACGLSVVGLSRLPFAPEFTNNPPRVMGLAGFEGTLIEVSPCLAGYVGGDALYGAMECGLQETGETRLLMDIGTNGEMLLAHDDRVYACATAAGPAFEGAHIAHGCAAIPGAIRQVSVVEGGLVCDTVDGAPAVGICGSGLVDAVACLLETGDLSEGGKLSGEVSLAEGVTLTTADIRQVQLAKAAMRAGVQVLCKHAGIEEDRIGLILLAGGFGNVISPASAQKIGLLPTGARVVAVGNTAGKGAATALTRPAHSRAAMDELLAQTSYIELSTDDDFEDVFVDNLVFE